MKTITVKSPLLNFASDAPMTPAMTNACVVISGVIDRIRIPASVDNSIWLDIPSQDLRGKETRTDNVWLKTCLSRLTVTKLSGEYRGEPWEAVLISQWHITDNGRTVRILVTPAAIQALQSAETFAKIEESALYKLRGSAKLLYMALSDKKRQTDYNYAEYTLDELYVLFNVESCKSYRRWNNFRERIIDPAISGINDFGTVKVRMELIKQGVKVIGVRFLWNWKSIDEARETDEENQRHSVARRKQQPDEPDAPPTIISYADRLKQEWLDWSNANPGGIYSDFLHEKRSRKS